MFSFNLKGETNMYQYMNEPTYFGMSIQLNTIQQWKKKMIDMYHKINIFHNNYDE